MTEKVTLSHSDKDSNTKCDGWYATNIILAFMKNLFIEIIYKTFQKWMSLNMCSEHMLYRRQNYVNVQYE